MLNPLLITWWRAGQKVQDSLHGLNLLSYAEVGDSPPESWVESFALFQQGLQPFLHSLTAQQMKSVGPVHQGLSLAWWTLLLARIHINSFRCDR